MNAKGLRERMGRGDWMVGGSRDEVGERTFGFGPQLAAHVASMAYAEAAEACRCAPPERFIKTLCVAFEECLRESLGGLEA